MIRRSPAEVYLKYLLLHGKRYTNAQVIEICQFAQVDYLGEWYLERLRAQLDPPRPFFPADVSHRASRTWLLVNGLSQIFVPDEYGRKAFELLKKPRLKEFVEASLISNAPPLAIAHAIEKTHNTTCAPATIERYRAFFWDVSVLDSTELRALLVLRFEQFSEHPVEEIKKQYPLLKKAYWSDSRRAAANLPFSPVSALLAQIRMGVMPSNFDVAKVMKQTLGVSTLRIYEAVMNDGPGDSKKAYDLAIVAEKLSVVLKEVEQPQEEMQQQLAAIVMRTDENATPTIHQLGTSFTTDNGPKEEQTNDLPIPDDYDGSDGSEEPHEGAR